MKFYRVGLFLIVLIQAASTVFLGRPKVELVEASGVLRLGSHFQQLQGVVGGKALKPVIYVHDLKRGSRKVHLTPQDALWMTELDVPVPQGQEPAAQRFRAPDLVWYHFSKADEDQRGFSCSHHFPKLPRSA